MRLCTMTNITKTLFAFGLLVCFLSIRGAAQSLEEFQQQQMQAYTDYAKKDADAFAVWKKQQAMIYDAWSREAKTYEKTHVKNVNVTRQGERSVGKQDIDFRSGEVSVEVVAGNVDSAAAVAEAKTALRKNVAEAVMSTDSQAIAAASKQAIAAHVEDAVKQAPVNVKKKDGVYIATAKGSRAMAGDKGILALIAPDGAEAPGPVDASVEHTSLIVDARDVNLEACLIPAVVAPDGAELYGPKWVAKEYAIHGMASWVTTLEEARKDSRCGADPLVAKAQAKPAKRRVAVRAGDAKAITRLRGGSNIIRECKVIIVTN